MNNILEKIKSLINSLPEKDLSLGLEFIEARRFEELQELVDSAIVKMVKFNFKHPEEVDEIKVERLRALKAEVDSYCLMLFPTGGIYETYNDDLYD